MKLQITVQTDKRNNARDILVELCQHNLVELAEEGGFELPVDDKLYDVDGCEIGTIEIEELTTDPEQEKNDG